MYFSCEDDDKNGIADVEERSTQQTLPCHPGMCQAWQNTQYTNTKPAFYVD